jgi:putative ABC transport system ATP-binding protein
MNDPKPVLRMEGVSKSFPTPRNPVEVLHQVSLAVYAGEFVAVTGPSGSGKSTCLHLAALLDYPSSGKVTFEGQDVSAATEPQLCDLRKRKVGMVFQKYCLLPHRSVFENVLFRFRYLDHDRADTERRVSGVIETMGLTAIADRPARLLSGGEMQRVAIARAVAHAPRLLIADEPTGNLDRDSAQVVMDCFRKLNGSGMTILMVTHNEALLDFCSRHLLCRDGRIETSVH